MDNWDHENGYSEMIGLNNFVQKKKRKNFRGNSTSKGHAWTLIVLKKRSECWLSL